MATTQEEPESFRWDREKIKQVLHELSKLPDFDNLPIPAEWGKHYDIPITPAKSLDLKSYLAKNKETQLFARYDKYETKPPAPGGLREVKEEEPMHLILESRKKVIIDENGNEMLVPLHEEMAPSTESNSSEQPVSQEHSSTNAVQVSDDGLRTSGASLRFDV
jgi:hypothetical protein